MSSSQRIAAAVALRELGYKVTPDGVVVSAVDVGAPADGVLEPDDVIVGANGKDIAGPEDLSQVMSGVKPGETVTLRIERDGAEQTVQVGTKASDDDPPRAIMGIIIEPELELPVDITIDTGEMEGPPPAAFALDIIDELGPTDIDHGEKVVATGEIALDGSCTTSAESSRKRSERARPAPRLPGPGRQRGRCAQVRGRASHRPGFDPRRGVARSGNGVVAASGNNYNALGGNCDSLVKETSSNLA